MIIDQAKIATWRKKLIVILTDHTDPTDLLEEMVPNLGQLLVLADVAVKIRDAYHHEDDGALTHMMRVNGTLAGAMRGLDDLEEAAMKAEGIVPLHPRRSL